MQGDFVEQVKKTVGHQLSQVHTCVPGKIVSFDPSICQATVLPSMKIKKPDGEMMDYPQITGVPVLFPQYYGQKATIAFPVKPDDGCLILFAEQALDQFLYQRDTGTDLRFDLSNAVAIVGIFAAGNPLMHEACGQNAIIVQVESAKLTVKKDLIQMDAASVVINGDVTLNGKMTSTGDVVAAGISLDHHTHPGDSGGVTGGPQ